MASSSRTRLHLDYSRRQGAGAVQRRAVMLQKPSDIFSCIKSWIEECVKCASDERQQGEGQEAPSGPTGDLCDFTAEPVMHEYGRTSKTPRSSTGPLDSGGDRRERARPCGHLHPDGHGRRARPREKEGLEVFLQGGPGKARLGPGTLLEALSVDVDKYTARAFNPHGYSSGPCRGRAFFPTGLSLPGEAEPEPELTTSSSPRRDRNSTSSRAA
jgi:hypothetical protein